MSEWIKNLVGFLLIFSVALQMLPNSKYEQYIRLFMGFLMILLILWPILKIGSADSYLENRISEFLQEQECLEQEIALQKEIFAEESGKKQVSGEEKLMIDKIEKVQVEVMIDD